MSEVAPEQQGQVSTSTEVQAAPVAAKKAPAKRAPAKKAAPKRVRRTKAQIESDEIADLRRQLEAAQLRAAVAENQKSEAVAAVKELKPAKAASHTFHFVEDGFTLLGKTWYRGQQITIVEGTEDWESCLDRYGNFALSASEYEQMERYDGTVFYREGPWPGLPFDSRFIYEPGQKDEKGNEITPSDAEIRAIEKANKEFKRG